MSKINVLVLLMSIFLLMMSGSGSGAGISSKGFKGGVNIADFYGTNIVDEQEEAKIGFVAGSFIRYNFSPLFAIQPEILFSMKGAKLLGDQPSYFEEIYVLYYLEVPILAKLTVPTAGTTTPNLFLGPTLAIKLSDEKEINGQVIDDANVTTFDPGVALGLGLDYRLGYTKLLFEFRYTLGVQKIDKSDFSFDWKNRVVSFMAGYSF